MNSEGENTSIEIYNAFCVAPSKLKPWHTFFYVDCPQYLADKLFDEHGLRPLFFKERWTADGKYIGVTCFIRKKRIDDFLLCMYQLQKNMLICGYTDYEEFCRSITEELEEDE